MSKRTFGRLWLATGLLLALSVNPALAGVHDNIVLKNYNGDPVTDLTGTTQLENAFSFKQTCFGTTGCHGDTSLTDSVLQFTYDQIEGHNYHAQLAANDHYGWKAYNPDGDKWESGPGPKGKSWVQAQGHMGAW